VDPVRLSCEVRSVDGASLIEVDGDLSGWDSDTLEQALSKACDCEGDMVILDLTRARSLGASALRVLQNAHERLGPGRKMCAVACGRPRAVLEMTRLDEIIQVYPRLKDVLAADAGDER